MTKVLSVVLTLITLIASSAVFANDLVGFTMKTKEIVRMKLWYDGLSQINLADQKYRAVKKVELSEELNRALDKSEL